MDKMIKRVMRGDKDAFVEMIKPIEKKLYVIAKSRLKNEEDVKDAIQETIYMGYKNIKQLRDEEKFYSWITKILINNCNNFYNQYDNKCHIQYEESELDKNNENEYLRVDEKIDFFIFLELLDDVEKEIFILFYVEEYTTSKISDILKINENTVKTKLRRARQKIQSYIERGNKYGV